VESWLVHGIETKIELCEWYQQLRIWAGKCGDHTVQLLHIARIDASVRIGMGLFGLNCLVLPCTLLHVVFSLGPIWRNPGDIIKLCESQYYMSCLFWSVYTVSIRYTCQYYDIGSLESLLTLWSRSSSKCYLRIQSAPQRKHHTSPLQRSTG
jgi:hypothetical protein